jgi:predicted flap endonuclease-1-like 5' DNA nuclease
VFGAGLWALSADVPVANALWYLPAWYGYLLTADALLFRLRGESFVATRRRELGWMAFWSVPFWFLFEAFNLRLRNWSYVFTLRGLPIQGVDSALAFATVVPACLLHAELTVALGLWRRARGKPRPLGRSAARACLALGVGSAAATLLWPRYAFPLVWFVPLGVAEWVCYRAGAPSLLRDVEEGRWTRIASLLTGGLWAGFVWELFNWRARTKWIYTVPGFERPKLFEMPLAGYGGFPVLAISAFSFYSMVSLLRSGRARRWLPAAVVVGLTFSAVTLAFVARDTTISRRPLLEELAGLDAAAVARLRAAGLPTPERLERAVRRKGLTATATRAGLPVPLVAGAAAEASLALHKGMGVAFARLLERAGVAGVADLARADPKDLASRIERSVRPGERVPRPEIVRVWVRDARPDGVPSR